MRSYYYIAILSLEWGGGGGVGEYDKRSYLNPKSRTLEYLLSARLFTLASFGELVGTREEVIHCFCKVYFSKLHTCLARHNDRLSSKHFMDHVLQLFKTAGVLLLFANQSKT